MKKNFKEFLPIGILNVVGVVSIIRVLTSDYIFMEKQYVGLALLLISTFLFFINRKIYKYFTGITLILGLLGFVGFSVVEYTFGISIIQIQFIPFIVLLIYFYIFRGNL